MGRILGLVNWVWATAQERKMHAIRQRFNLYAGGSLSADVRRFFQLINADEVLGTHRSCSPIICIAGREGFLVSSLVCERYQFGQSQCIRLVGYIVGKWDRTNSLAESGNRNPNRPISIGLIEF